MENDLKKAYIGIVIFLATLSSQTVAAWEPIMITYSDNMDKVVFDGKWSFFLEWKHSSLNELYSNGATIELRTAHQGDFIYVFVDAVSMTNYNKGSDMSIICFDGKNDKNKLPDNDDYCFGVALGRNEPFVLRGGSPLEQTSHFTNIPNPGVIGVAAVSDENDRYTSIPHAGYEFRIPIELIGRSDTYGFYLGVYDSHTKTIYAYPENLTSTSDFGIPSPSQWGEIVSPDKSLPEFPLPVIALLTAFITVIFITRKAYSFKNR